MQRNNVNNNNDNRPIEPRQRLATTCWTYEKYVLPFGKALRRDDVRTQTISAVTLKSSSFVTVIIMLVTIVLCFTTLETTDIIPGFYNNSRLFLYWFAKRFTFASIFKYFFTWKVIASTRTSSLYLVLLMLTSITKKYRWSRPPLVINLTLYCSHSFFHRVHDFCSWCERFNSFLFTIIYSL